MFMILTQSGNLCGFWTKILLLFFLIFLSFATADELKFRVDVIIAGNSSSGVDSRLADLYKDISKCMKYTSLRLVSSQIAVMQMSRDCLVSMPENSALTLTLVSYKHEQAALKLQYNSVKSFNTLINLRKDCSFLFNGPATLEGDIIVAVTLI